MGRYSQWTLEKQGFGQGKLQDSITVDGDPPGRVLGPPSLLQLLYFSFSNVELMTAFSEAGYTHDE